MKQYSRSLRLPICILLITLIVGCICTAHAVTYPYDTVCMGSVNLRRSANTSSVVLARLAQGDEITILGVSGDYYQLTFGSITGYAQKIYVDGTDASPDPSPDPARTIQQPLAVYTYPYDTVVLDYVKFRKTASETGTVIRMLVPNEEVTVVELYDNGFAQIKVNGTTGYAYAAYLLLADIPAPTVEPTPTPDPDTAKFSDLQRGDAGSTVVTLQTALIELGYLDGEADGSFGANTETALKLLQKRNGMEQDGIADAELQRQMYFDTIKDINGYRQYVSVVPSVSGVTLEEGNTGEPVKLLQNRLAELGYYEGEITGVFDQETENAYRAFESKQGIEEDGIATPEDLLVIYGGSALTVWAIVTPTPSPTIEPPEDTVKLGDESDDALRVQERLAQLGYYEGELTGIFDEDSEDALKAFQANNLITDDGVCGSVTRTILFGISPIYAEATAPVVVPDETAEPITEENTILITAGSKGEMVLSLQMRLQELGYYTSRQDGIYLSDDITAVRSFQENNGLTIDGKAGYETQYVLYSEEAVAGTQVLMPTLNASLRYGSTGTDVSTLQNRLIALGYLADGDADGNYGLLTKKAVISFQKANDLTADGVVGDNTLQALNSENAIAYQVVSSSTLQAGAEGSAVEDMQEKLIALGYLQGSADGVFGSATSSALIAFQKANYLTADGLAGTLTLSALGSSSAIGATTTDTSTSVTTTTAPVSTEAPSISVFGIKASQVIYAYWYDELRDLAKEYPNVTVYDFITGISWQVNLFSFGAHADGEPLTETDTNNMNRAFGGETTWTPKPVWVVFSNGSVYMASTHNTPHSTYHISDNNFNGHICIHFPRTQSQVEAIGPYATSHQDTIDLGWAATLNRIY